LKAFPFGCGSAAPSLGAFALMLFARRCRSCFCAVSWFAVSTALPGFKAAVFQNHQARILGRRKVG
jgi:hypothetical protein